MIYQPGMDRTTRYLKFPKALIEEGQYQEVSFTARSVYILLYDRLSISEQNGWYDDKGIYVYYSVERLEKVTGYSKPTIRKILNELQNCGLVFCQKDGRNNKFYLEEIKENREKSFSNRENFLPNRENNLPNEKPNREKIFSNREKSFSNREKNDTEKGKNFSPNKTISIRLKNKTNINNTIDCPTDNLSARKIKKDDTPYSEIVEIFNETCSDLPSVKQITDSRKKAIKARFKDLEKNTDKIRELFRKVQESDFLTGRKEGSNWRACFDWVMKPANMAKILEGNYENREVGRNDAAGTSPEGEPDWYREYAEYEEQQRRKRMAEYSTG